MVAKKITLVVGMLLIVSFLPIINADADTNTSVDGTEFTTCEYPNENELVITFHLTEITQGQITTQSGTFTTLKIPDTGFTGELGCPQLPAVTQLYAIPCLQPSVEIVSAHLMEARQIGNIYPLQAAQADCDCGDETAFAYNESAYQKDSLTPDRFVDVLESGKLRDIPFIQLRFYPVQYNPSLKTAFIYDNITVRLTFPSNEPVNVEPSFTQKPFYDFYEAAFNNWQGFTAHTGFQSLTGTKDSGCDYLIITHQDFYAQAQDLATWKQHTGFLTKTVNVSDIGTTYNQIIQYIKNAYQTWTPRPSYILLLGDAGYVPTTYVNGVATDLWYAAVDGTDYFPDLFIGRIPADTPAQADVMIQKTIKYEQTPPTIQSFYQNVVVAAYFQDDYGDHYEDRRFVLTSEEVRDYLLTQGYDVQRIYDTLASITPTHYNNDYYANGEPLPADLLRPTFAWNGNAADICAAIQQGIFLLNHRDHGMETGWGDPLFTIADFDSFSNGDLLPVVFSLNCLTGKFDTGECFCEAFLKKDDGGAVAIFGATEVSYSGYNDYLCRGMYDAMWPAFDPEMGNDIALHHLGEILNYGKVFMTETWGDPWGEEEYTFELFHCFGDPSLDMYTALPTNLEVTYEEYPGSVHVTVKGNDMVLPDVLVCLSQENGFLVSERTDNNGVAVFDITGASMVEPISLVATAHNYLCHQENFTLNQAPERPDPPEGSLEGRPSVEYLYSACTTDPEVDQIYYNFSWGDGTFSGWVGPFASGVNGFARHTWAQKGTFNITVKAMDDKGAESEWSDPIPVVMPLSLPASHPILEWIYRLLMERFPLLQVLFQVAR